MKLATEPWTIERKPIESRGGSNTCFLIGPMNACIYDDWRAREAGISEQDQIYYATLISQTPQLLQALTNMVKMWDFLKPAHDELFESKVDVTLSEARAILKRIQEQATQ